MTEPPPVTLSKEPEDMPVIAKVVEVALVVDRFTKVLVAVEVANIELKNPCAALSWVVEALPPNVCRPVHVLARVKSTASAPPRLVSPAPRSEVK